MNLHTLLKKLNPRNSLVAHISYATAGISLLLSAVFAYYTARIGETQLEEDQGFLLAQHAENFMNSLDYEVYEQYERLRTITALEVIRNPSVSVSDKQAFLDRLQQSIDIPAWFELCDGQGNSVAYTEKSPLWKIPTPSPWCAERITRPFVGDTIDVLSSPPAGQATLDIAIPIYDRDGWVRLVLWGHFSHTWTEELSRRNILQPGEDILILNRQGIVLAGNGFTRQNIPAFQTADWQQLTRTSSGKQYFAYESGDDAYLVGYASNTVLHEYANPGWIVLARMHKNFALFPIMKLRQRIAITGGVLSVLFALLGGLMARRIVRPLRKMTAAAEQIASGRLNFPIPQVRGDGEVAHLSQALRIMVGQLTAEIQQRKEAEQELALDVTVFANNSEAVVITDAANRIVRVNEAFTRITGYTAEEVLGKDPRLLASGRMSQEFFAQMWRNLLQNGSWRGEIWNRRKNGEVFPEWMILSLVRDRQGNITHHIALYSDITEKKREEERIQFLASHDQLTGLPNRFLLNDRISQALAFAGRVNGMAAVMFIDLDHFKHINDTLGHDAGDELLRQVSERMRGTLRRTDTLARLGGDEFAVLLPKIDSAKEAALVAEKILATFSEPILLGEHQLTITGSIGISLYPMDGTTPSLLLRHADLAMYRAKHAGRNAMQFYQPEMTEQTTHRLQTEIQLRQAIEQQHFHLVYQPQVELASGRIVGMECLLRWHHPELGLISPMQFIPLAEDAGLIHAVGDWVLREVCMQGRRWQTEGYEVVRLSVNVSAIQFRRKDFVERLQTILEETGFDPLLLEIEITESALMELGEASEATLRALKAIGIQIALDDFGTGYSSLGRLKALPFDLLKVDQSFIRDLHTDPDDAAIVRAIIQMSHEMGIRVIAEGVETETQIAFLKKLQCHEYQGKLFSSAVPADEATRFLARRT